MTDRRPYRSFRSYLMIIIASAVILTALGISASHYFWVDGLMKREFWARARADSSLAQRRIRARTDLVKDRLGKLTADPYLLGLLMEGSPHIKKALAALLRKQYPAKNGVRFFVSDPGGTEYFPAAPESVIRRALEKQRQKGWVAADFRIGPALTYVFARQITRGPEVLGIGYCVYRLPGDRVFLAGLYREIGGRFFYLQKGRLHAMGGPNAAAVVESPKILPKPGGFEFSHVGGATGLLGRTALFDQMYYFISDKDFRRETRRYIYFMAVMGLCLLIISVAVAIIMARKLSEPLRQMAMQAGDIAVGERESGFDLKGNRFYEFDRVAETFNTMVTRLKSATAQRKLAIEQEHSRKMEAIGTLAGGVAHDFNNIVHIVSGYVQLMLQKRGPDDPDYDSLTQVDVALSRAADLIAQLLAFGRKAEGRPTQVDINAAVEQVRRLLEWTIPRMISIWTDLAPRPMTIVIDPAQFDQILMNLATNACDAMPDGGRLTISTSPVAFTEAHNPAGAELEPGNYVRLTVTDTGHGIPQELIGQIYDPFFTTKDLHKGTGLGLATVYGIVTSRGGHIRCSSAPGEGATFEIYFPLIQAGTQQQAPSGAEEADQGRIEGGPERVLLVDDEPAVLDIGRQFLEEYGYAVITAPSGEEALDVYAAKGKTIDLIILDLSMPGMGGKQCLEKLLSLDPGVKVIIASGYAQTDDEGREPYAGSIGFLAKPFRAEELLYQVRTALDD